MRKLRLLAPGRAKAQFLAAGVQSLCSLHKVYTVKIVTQKLLWSLWEADDKISRCQVVQAPGAQVRRRWGGRVVSLGTFLPIPMPYCPDHVKRAPSSEARAPSTSPVSSCLGHLAEVTNSRCPLAKNILNSSWGREVGDQ
jgi:hypothetical protein